jgi:hypothetical protein
VVSYAALPDIYTVARTAQIVVRWGRFHVLVDFNSTAFKDNLDLIFIHTKAVTIIAVKRLTFLLDYCDYNPT